MEKYGTNEWKSMKKLKGLWVKMHGKIKEFMGENAWKIKGKNGWKSMKK